MKRLKTTHELRLGDARDLGFLEDNSIHLVLTSPPYWTLKEYNGGENQLGSIEDYDRFIDELNKVWSECLRVLVPGGRAVVVVGDVLLSRRSHGRHRLIPLHADIQVAARRIGFDNLTPIIWYKIGSANFEANTRSNILGQPYQPNAIVKNDMEFILMLRKPGGYRSPTKMQKEKSRIPRDEFMNWFTQVWTDIGGASHPQHPAPFPLELAERLVRMYSFVGDTVLDPFVGTGTTILAAIRHGRSSIGIETDQEYFIIARKSISENLQHLEYELEFRLMEEQKTGVAPCFRR